MIRYPGRRLKALSTGLYLIACFALVTLFTGAFDTALAADEPTATAKSSKVDDLDIPGSFKDLPDAKDPVTAKHTAERMAPVAANTAASTQFEIDSAKVSAGGPTAARVSIVAPAALANPNYTTSPAFDDGELVDFDATAYCLRGRTASGVDVRPGMIAADPRVLPLGTVVHLRSGSYTGTYTVMDTGGRIKGRRVDVYVPSHKEAMQFGRRQVKIKVIGRGAAKADRTRKNILASER